ncbi:MAG: hypothetical protein AAGH76_00315 [Pseudomonadota bacterium]
MANVSNVLQFPTARARRLATCPQCGKISGTRRIGRLLWAYCEAHEARWVVRDFEQLPVSESPTDVTESLALLSQFAEVGC